MRKIENTYLKHFFCFAVFLLSLNALAQVPVFEKQPTFSFQTDVDVCVFPNSPNNFIVKFPYTDTFFNEENDFIVELSDADGSFENPTNLAILTDNALNTDFFGPEGNFSFPEGTAGENYRIQVRGTSPAVTSPASEPFAVYYLPDVGLTINSDKNLTLCNGASAAITITLDDDDYNVEDYEYAWFFNGNIIDGENGSTLIVDTPGNYRARFYAGSSCTFNTNAKTSNTIEVSSANVEQIFIEGDSTINLCANETYDLVASVNNASYIYNWYKDGELVSSGNASTYTTEATDQYGVYKLEVNANGCEVASQEVTVQPQDGAGFEVTIDSALSRVILPRETIDLIVEVNTTSTDLSYQWYRDGIELLNTQSEIRIVSSGEYYVEVIDTSSSCAVALNSETYTFLDPTSLAPIIRVDNYEECNSAAALLTVTGVSVIVADGSSYELTSKQIDLLKYQWYKDSVAIADEDNVTLNVVSYVNNGEYFLNVYVGEASTLKTGDSEIENILLSPNSQIESSSISNKLCTGSVINLSIDEIVGFDYTWFKDEVALEVEDITNVNVVEVGEYYVVYDGFGCSNVTESVIIEAFDEDVLITDPLSTAVLIPEETVTLSASGADSYKWINELGVSISFNETVEVSKTGIYTLIGSVGECQIEKEIEVIPDDGSYTIPNIITPFGSEGVNDTWAIPNKYSYQSNVQVIIYNSRGDDIFNTIDYQNNWPVDNSTIRDGMLFYFKVIQDEILIKAGTISVLE